MSASFRIVEEGPIYVATIDGEVDLVCARELEAEILAGLSSDAHLLVLDLEGVRYLDSSGVSLLFELQRVLAARRQRLALVLPEGSPLWRLFGITSLADVISVSGTIADAKRVAV